MFIFPRSLSPKWSSNEKGLGRNFQVRAKMTSLDSTFSRLWGVWEFILGFIRVSWQVECPDNISNTELLTAIMPSTEKKTVHFVRHCQSTWNEAMHVRKMSREDEEMQSEAYLDAPLSPLGEEQAASIQHKIQALNAEVAITSPFRRAIETCLRSYGSQNIVVSHWCGERGESICDIGSTRDNLQKHYPMLDFSDVPPNVWWYVEEDLKDQLTDQRKCYARLLSNGTFLMGETDGHFQPRLDRFYEFLQSRRESNIVVFSHSMFLRNYLNKYYGRPLLQLLPNGSISTYSL